MAAELRAGTWGLTAQAASGSTTALAMATLAGGGTSARAPVARRSATPGTGRGRPAPRAGGAHSSTMTVELSAALAAARQARRRTAAPEAAPAAAAGGGGSLAGPRTFLAPVVLATAPAGAALVVASDVETTSTDAAVGFAFSGLGAPAQLRPPVVQVANGNFAQAVATNGMPPAPPAAGESPPEPAAGGNNANNAPALHGPNAEDRLGPVLGRAAVLTADLAAPALPTALASALAAVIMEAAGARAAADLARPASPAGQELMPLDLRAGNPATRAGGARTMEAAGCSGPAVLGINAEAAVVRAAVRAGRRGVAASSGVVHRRVGCWHRLGAYTSEGAAW